MQRSLQLRALDEHVRTLLPSPCADHCRLANIRGGILSLAAESPAWASRLRFHAPQILRDLRQNAHLQVNKVHVLVSPTRASVERPRRRRADLSHKSASLLHDTALNINDPQLRAALFRIARRGRGSQ